MIRAFPPQTEYTSEQQMLALACEEEMGLVTAHCLGRWAALQASEQAAEAVNKTGGGSGGGIYESAIYAALCGHTLGMLKVIPGALHKMELCMVKSRALMP